MHKVITVDGSSGVGKGTLSLFLSNYLNWSILDSGAIYRLAALFVRLNKFNIEDSEVVDKIFNLPVEFNIGVNGIEYMLSGANVSSDIRTEECGMLASKIARCSNVRKALLSRQKDFDNGLGLVADGRDMGTVVFPEACLKFYLVANSKSRAQRRYDELLSKNISVSYDEVHRNIKLRDEQDMNRTASPLVPASDAVIIDTSDMNIINVQEVAITKIKKLPFTS